MAETEFSQTLTALERLQSMFTCNKCNVNSGELFNIASCTHAFCKNCADKCMSKSCPICNIFANANEMRPNIQLNTLANSSNKAIILLKTKTSKPQSSTSSGSETTPLVIVLDEKRRMVEEYAKSVENCFKPANSSKPLYTPSPKLVIDEQNFHQIDSDEEMIYVNIGSPPPADVNGNENETVKFNEKDSNVYNLDYETFAETGVVEKQKSVISNRTKTRKRKLIQIEHSATDEKPLATFGDDGNGKKPKRKYMKRKSKKELTGSDPNASTVSSSTSKSASNVSFTRLIGDQRDKKGNSSLQKACMDKNVDFNLIKRLLLEEHACPNVMDHNRYTPLHEAAHLGFTASVELLLKNGAIVDVGGGEDLITPLHDAIVNCHTKVVELLLLHGADVDRRQLHGYTAMDFALINAENVEIIQLLNDCKMKRNKFQVMPPKVEPRLPPTKTTKPILCHSGLTNEDQASVRQLARILGARVEGSFTVNVTHLIVPTSLGGRTAKYFYALSTGKWIVTMEWVIECLENGSFVDEEPYEASGSKLFPQTGAPKLARINQMMLQPPLLTGAHIFCRDFNSPMLEDFKKVMELAGAKIVKREPKNDIDLLKDYSTVLYHAEASLDVGNVDFFIVYDQNNASSAEKPKVNTDRIRTVPLKWVLDCFEHFKILEISM